jgi:hypothetical protein
MRIHSLVVVLLPALAACGSSAPKTSGSSTGMTTSSIGGSAAGSTGGHSASGSSGLTATSSSTTAASSSSSGSGSTTTTTGSSSSASTTASSSGPTGSTGSTTSTAGSSSSTGSVGSTSGSGGPTSGSGGSTSGSGGTTGVAITGLPTEQWTWVDFPDAHCRDGSATGVGINLNPASTKVMIFLEGGGACFNQLTCQNNPSHFDAASFSSQFSGAQPGLFDRTNAANPLRDWSFVYVPYCTGDVHAGAQPSGQVQGVSGTQAFVGYQNVSAYLQRLVPTFAGASQVLVTGISAGGFGAAANYDQVAAAFAPIPVDLIDDSGPFMRAPALATCLQTKFRQTWNLDATLLADCGADCADNTNFLLDYGRHVVSTHAGRKQGLIESTDDGTITLFFGFGKNNCAGFGALTATEFDAGLVDIRNALANEPSFGTFYFAGTDHTSLSSGTYYTRAAGGVNLTSWVGDLLDGGISDVGP